MGLSVRVKEYTGELVADCTDRHVNRLWRIAAANPAKYPLFSGVDPYDDTYFNARQASRLEGELAELGTEVADPELRVTSATIAEMASLLAVRQGRPHHRLLIFVGD